MKKMIVNHVLNFLEGYRRKRIITKIIQYDGTESFIGYSYEERPIKRYLLTFAFFIAIGGGGFFL